MAEIYYSSKTPRAAPEALTVTQLNEFVKRMIDSSPILQNLTVRGEISNFKNHYATGHFYFTLKDEASQLKAVMFRSAASRLKFLPEDGMKVTVRGHLSAFTRDGVYQIYCDTMEPDGVGALYVAFEQLKRKLEAEGLFSPDRKRPLPKIPARIGIITSPTGAAVRDMIHVTGRRFPAAEILVYPALVQGPDAPPQLVSGLEYFNRTGSADVIILGRGGGSLEDLWAFNDERVARAVAASRIPVISAVGHETDFTICDFAADLRAPTPSAAAEVAVPDTAELKRKITNLIAREAGILSSQIRLYRERLDSLANSRPMRSPMSAVDDRRVMLDALADRLRRAESSRIASGRAGLGEAAGKLSALDPMATLSRGYSAVYKSDGALVRSVRDVKPGDAVTFRSVGGEAVCTVDEVKEDSQ